MVKTEYEYIQFELVEQKEKTSVYCIKTKTLLILGYVKWSGRWRQYIFEPLGDTIWSIGCLNDIIDFIKQLMDERKHKNV